MTDGVLHSPLVLAFRDDSRGMHLGQHECHPKCRLNVAATMDTKNWGIGPPGFRQAAPKRVFFLWQHGFRPRILTHQTWISVYTYREKITNSGYTIYDNFFRGVAILRGCLYGACAHNFGRWEPFGDYRHANSMPLAWFSSDKPCFQTKYGEQCVCMHACLSFVCLSALFVYLKNGTLKLGLLLCTLPVAVDRSDSDDNAIRYVLPVLLMTSYVFTHWDLRTAKSCARISVRLMVNYSHELSCRLIRHAVTLASYAVAANSASGGGRSLLSTISLLIMMGWLFQGSQQTILISDKSRRIVLALSAVYAETALLRLQRIYCTNVTQQVHEFTTNPQQIDGVWALTVGLQENRGLKICKITAASRKNWKKWR